MKTIERKLLVVFGGFIIAIILVEFITNNFLLEKYYINENKEDFVRIGNELSNYYDENLRDFEEYIISVDKEEGISVFVIDYAGNIQYTSRTRRSYEEISKRMREIALQNKDMQGYTFGIFEDTSSYKSNYKITLTKRLRRWQLSDSKKINKGCSR